MIHSCNFIRPFDRVFTGMDYRVHRLPSEILTNLSLKFKFLPWKPKLPYLICNIHHYSYIVSSLTANSKARALMGQSPWILSLCFTCILKLLIYFWYHDNNDIICMFIFWTFRIVKACHAGSRYKLTTILSTWMVRSWIDICRLIVGLVLISLGGLIATIWGLWLCSSLLL